MTTHDDASLIGLPEHMLHKIAHDDRKLRKIGRKLRARLSRPLIVLDVWKQKWQLRNYVTAIENVTEVRPFTGPTFCIFHYYETDGRMSASVGRILAALAAQNVNIVLVSNRKLSPAQTEALSQYAAVLLERANIGQDFGGYKDAVYYLTNRLQADGITPERVIFMNDSVFFIEKGLQDYVCELLGPEDIIHACQNWYTWHHLQSFGFSVSGPVFLNPAHQSYWRNYLPVSERRHAIEKGEMALSDTLMGIAATSRVIYSVSDVAKRASAISTEPDFWMPRLGRAGKALTQDSTFLAASKQARLMRIADEIGRSSFTNEGSYAGVKLAGMPFIKKNIVYMSWFRFHQVEQWVGDIMTADESRDFLHVLRLKGDPASAYRAKASGVADLVANPA